MEVQPSLFYVYARGHEAEKAHVGARHRASSVVLPTLLPPITHSRSGTFAVDIGLSSARFLSSLLCWAAAQVEKKVGSGLFFVSVEY